MVSEILFFGIALLTLASWIFWLITLFFAYSFFIQQTDSSNDYRPPVSILIPVKGLDAGAYNNFASFCSQNYPEYEVLVGVYDPDDPIRLVIEQLQRDFSGVAIRLIIAQPPGTNRKAAMLNHLVGYAKHPVIIAVDSDMRATPEYLSRVVSPLADPSVGLVTCTYRGIFAETMTARLESLYMGSTFLPLVLVARKFLSMRFAMGATLALRRTDLDRLGGFASVVDYLADDFQIGERMADLGYTIYLSHYIITNVLGETTFRHHWDRLVRLSRTNHVCRPLEYPIQVVYFSTPLALILLVVGSMTPLTMSALIFSMLIRWLVSWKISGWTNNLEMRRWLVLLPLQDGLDAVVWAVGLLGPHMVTWRGHKYRVLPDGRIVSADMPAPQPVEIGES